MLYQIPLESKDSVNIATACLSYLSLFGVTSPLSCFPSVDQIGGLFGRCWHACAVLDRLFIWRRVHAVWRCYQHLNLPLNGALSANNGEQHYPEFSGTKPSAVIGELEYSLTDLTVFTRGGKFQTQNERVRPKEKRKQDYLTCRMFTGTFVE